MRLGNQVAIVTGGASGIGKAIATVFHAQGAKVLVVDRNADALTGQRTEGDARWSSLVLDLTEVDAPGRVFDACARCFGTPTILVNNAGIGAARPAHLTTDEDWDRYLDLNLRAVFRLSREALARFPQEGGAILNIASILGLIGFEASAPYSASKAAVIGLTRQMAADYGPRGVRVNAIAPGLIATPLTEQRIRSTPAFVDGYVRASPLERAGTPEDVAMAAVYLCSPEAAFVTGQVLAVDGGWSATKYRSMPR